MLNPGVIPPPLPPGEAELPCDDGAAVETERHRLGREILVDPLHTWLQRVGRADVYVAANMALYYSQLQAMNNDFALRTCSS